MKNKIFIIIIGFLIIGCCIGNPSKTVSTTPTVTPTVSQNPIYKSSDSGLELKLVDDIWYFKNLDKWEQYPVLSDVERISSNEWIATFKDGSGTTNIAMIGDSVVTKSTNYPEIKLKKIN